MVRLVDRFGVSERRACGVVGRRRSTRRRLSAVRADADAACGAWLCELARARPRWGRREAHDVAAREQRAVDSERTLRLWRAHRLRRPPQRRHKRRRSGDGAAAMLRAEHPSHVWALGFQSDETASRRRLKLLNVIDESTREALAVRVDHSIGADKAAAAAEAIAAARETPAHPRTDNSPEPAADALRDWCRLSGTAAAYIKPGTPRENGCIESLNDRPRDECPNTENLANLPEARAVTKDRRHDYNHYRPHRPLKRQTPAAYAANHQPTTTTNQHPQHLDRLSGPRQCEFGPGREFTP